jgi:type II secretory pathway pseudopilin PulG
MRNQEAGFTLVEALIAIVILVFGLAAIANLILVASTSTSIGNTTTAATGLASETIERLKAIPFTDLVVGGSLTADAGIADCTEPGQTCVVAGNFNYQRAIPGVANIKVRWVITMANTQTRMIRVRAEPLSVAGVRARAEFTTMRSCAAVTIGCPAP